MITKQHIQIAVKEAQKARKYSNNSFTYRLGAIALLGGKVIARAHNTPFPNNYNYRRYGQRTSHAEATLISKAPIIEELLVVRIKADLSLTCSLPCKKCYQAIKDAGIRKVWYSDWDGNIQLLKVN